MYQLYPTNAFYLSHSAKGTTWKKHKYITKKKNDEGKTVYVYTTKGGSLADKIGITTLKRMNELEKEHRERVPADQERVRKNLEAAEKYGTDKDVENAQKAVDKYALEFQTTARDYIRAKETFYNTPLGKGLGSTYEAINNFDSALYALKVSIKDAVLPASSTQKERPRAREKKVTSNGKGVSRR